jgi:hypothetical protein
MGLLQRGALVAPAGAGLPSDVEVMWLMRRLGPDFKTIADSRRDNGAAVVGACRTFVLLCRDARLFSARLVALNGSKIRAVVSARKVAGRGRSRRKPPVSTFRSLSISRDCDEADAAEPGDAPEAVETALAALRARRSELDRLAARITTVARPSWAARRTLRSAGTPDACSPFALRDSLKGSGPTGVSRPATTLGGAYVRKA